MSSPKRRWFPFGRATFAVLVVFSVLVVWTGYQLDWIRQRRNVLANGWCGIVGERPPATLRPFGADGYSVVFKFCELSTEDRAAIPRIRSLFPEATVRE